MAQETLGTPSGSGAFAPAESEPDSCTTTLTVAVLTFHRPAQLARILPLLLEQVTSINNQQSGALKAGVLVVDNDPQASARPVVEGLSSGLVRYVTEARPGISAARNRAMDAVASDLLVFIDDDEQPHEDWLISLVRTWSETRAAAVSGRVVAQFAGDVDPWLIAGRFFVRRRLPTGTALDVAAAGNMLLDLRQVHDLGVRFADQFGLTGGEDTHFSRSLAKRGGRMVWCDESAVTDMVPPERMTRRWVLTRAFSHGNSAPLIEVELADSGLDALVVRCRSVIDGLVRCVIGVSRYAVGLIIRSDRHQARGLRSAYRGMGMLAGAAGLVYREYARDGRYRHLARFK